MRAAYRQLSHCDIVSGNMDGEVKYALELELSMDFIGLKPNPSLNGYVGNMLSRITHLSNEF
jgi:hypothetical protein